VRALSLGRADVLQRQDRASKLCGLEDEVEGLIENGRQCGVAGLIERANVGALAQQMLHQLAIETARSVDQTYLPRGEVTLGAWLDGAASQRLGQRVGRA
jgi:hypothetical protein